VGVLELLGQYGGGNGNELSKGRTTKWGASSINYERVDKEKDKSKKKGGEKGVGCLDKLS